MAPHKALGRGLNALFSTSSPVIATGGALAVEDHPNLVKKISVDKIKPNRHQPRRQFDEETLRELADSIRIHGVQQPLIVTQSPVDGEYELVAGERRLRASKLAGEETVPCLIKKMTNRERFEVALVENIQRQDLNAYEEALALDGLMREFHLTQEEVAEAIGKSRSSVANILRLLKLHSNVQAALRSGIISEGHAKCLAGLSEHSEQLRWLDHVVNKKLSVRELEALLSDEKTSNKVYVIKPEAAAKPLEVQGFEEGFQRYLARRVNIQSRGEKRMA
jgi:ParB family transcriptional regulator, chromosome partitioning protein